MLNEKEQAALRAIIDAAFTPEEKQVFQSQDNQVVELFMPMYTVLRDSVRRYIREGETATWNQPRCPGSCPKNKGTLYRMRLVVCLRISRASL